ncbi:MAG: hypothetical protein AAF225_08615 [Pseudomonadota bacterium]
MRLQIYALIFVLSACATQETDSVQGQYFAALAEERRAEERFPVLRDLPDSATTDGTTIDPATQGTLLSAAEVLSPVRQDAERVSVDAQLSVEEVAAELLREIALLRAKQGLPPSTITREDLRFPTPPPLDD